MKSFWKEEVVSMSFILGSVRTALCRSGNGVLNMVNQTRNGGGGGRPGGAIGL